jgi:hypothetical protein
MAMPGLLGVQLVVGNAEDMFVIFTEAECLIVEEALGNGTITTVLSENKGGGWLVHLTSRFCGTIAGRQFARASENTQVAFVASESAVGNQRRCWSKG